MSKKVSNRLELKSPEFGIRPQSFLALMNLPEFRERFLVNPGEVASSELGVPGVSKATLNTANRLIFKILSDKNFNAWASEFQRRIERTFPTINDLESVTEIATFVKAKANRAALMKEFSESVITHLSPGSYEQLIDQAVVNRGIIVAEPDIAVVPLTFIAVIVVLLIVAGHGRPSERISRLSVALTINQLDKRQLAAIRKRADL